MKWGMSPIGNTKEYRDEIDRLQKKLIKIQEILRGGLEADLEHGVAWINDRESKKFNKAYPFLSNALSVVAFYIEEEDYEDEDK